MGTKVKSSRNRVRQTAINIAERKQGGKGLPHSEEYFLPLIERALDVVVVVNSDGTIRYQSPSIQNVIGYKPEERQGKSVFELIHPDDMASVTDAFSQLLQNQVANAHMEVRLQHKDGSWRFIEAVGQNLLGHPVMAGIVVNLRDITERKRAEEALRESEQKYRTILEDIEDGYYEVDIAGNFTFFNDPMCRIIGYSRDEMMGMNNRQYMDKENAKKVYQAFNRVYTTAKHTKEFGWEIVRKDGTKRFIEASVSLKRNSKGEPIGFRGVAHDITERKEAEEALRQSEEYFRELTENILDVILVLDRDGNIRHRSPSFEHMMGKERGDKNLFELVHPDDMANATETFAELMQNPGATVHKEIRGQHRDGSWRTFEVVGKNLLDNPAVAGIVATWRDITERKQAEEEIRRLNEELEQRVIERTTQLQAVNKELEAFAYSVSHDLRAPLRSIDGFSQVLLEDYAGRLDEEGKDYLQRVRSASQRMAELIDDILNLSRLTRSEMRRETVDLSTLAQTIATELQQGQPQRQVEFIITPGLVVQGDPHLLRAALENLLGNAWKFTKKRAPARIEFGCAETDGQSAYFVRDNGVGFDMAYADKLFGAFQRLHSPSEFEGTGIGLATVQRIIHRHGGNIWAESAVEQGATFYFTL